MSTQLDDSTLLPTSCPHCSLTPAEYSIHHQLHFCNNCGKKVTTRSGNGSNATTPTNGNQTFATPVKPTTSNTANVATPDEDENVVTFKHSMQSPPPPIIRAMQDFDPTPMVPQRTMARMDHNANSTATSSSVLSSSSTNSAPIAPPSESIAAAAAAAVPLPSPTHSTSSLHTPALTPTAANANVITLTEEEFSQLESTIREEMKQAHNAETEILTMEFDNLSKEHQRLQTEKFELQRTLDEVMESFNKVVDEANKRKNDFTAQSSLLETELNQLRQTYNTQKSAFNTLKDAHTKLQTDHEERTLISNEQTSQLDKLRVDHDQLTTKYEKLHKQAQDKLAAASQEYRNLLTKNTEKDALISQLTSDLSLAHQSKQDAESAQIQLTERNAKLESLVDQKTAESLELRTQLTNMTAQYTDTRTKYDESQAIASRYKDQLVDTRERLRELEDLTRDATKFEKDAARMTGENAALAKENKELKSQLFDSFQVEKSLKAQLEQSGMNSTQAGETVRVARLEQELAALRANLNTKEKEHNELMAICTDLISQVETLKAQQGGT